MNNEPNVNVESADTVNVEGAPAEAAPTEGTAETPPLADAVTDHTSGGVPTDN